MNEPAPFQLDTVLPQQLDQDGDGALGEFELRLMARVLRGAAFQLSDAAQLRARLLNVSSEVGQQGVISELTLRGAPDVLSELKHKLGRRPKNRTQQGDSSEAQFVMLTDNVTDSTARLDELRLRPPKFLCINDDMEEGLDGSLQLLRDFYRSLLPQPSPFELPPSQPHPQADGRVLELSELQHPVSDRRLETLTVGLLAAGLVLLRLMCPIGLPSPISMEQVWSPLAVLPASVRAARLLQPLGWMLDPARTRRIQTRPRE